MYASYWLGCFFFSRAVLLVSQGEQLRFLFLLIYCHLHDWGQVCEIELVLFKGKQIFTILVQLNHVILLLIYYTLYNLHITSEFTFVLLYLGQHDLHCRGHQWSRHEALGRRVSEGRHSQHAAQPLHRPGKPTDWLIDWLIDWLNISSLMNWLNDHKYIEWFLFDWYHQDLIDWWTIYWLILNWLIVVWLIVNLL